MRAFFDDASRMVGRVISGQKATKKHVLKPANRAKYGIAGKGASKSTASAAYNAAIAKRQTEIGKRAIIGTSVLGGASAMGSDKKSYYNPMPAPRGTGRYT